ncbi:MAG: hypothetical protein CVT47_01955 [Thermoplasmata archaeon HGW-Thermoplasmata-2]|nr:MAG: hypothetical protein CVT47_01955 [Thermoplasmata archaeon HGW-Thermoplasmata-2]
MEDKVEWKMLDPAMKKVWFWKGKLLFGIIWLSIGLPTLLGWYYTPASDPEKAVPLWIFIISTLCLIAAFAIYLIWIPMYYARYRYALGKEGVLVHRGIWWKYRRTIPYGRIQHISIDQGPIEQIYKIYRVNSYTAGTGSAGGSSTGSGITGPEGQILGVRVPEPLRNEIMRHVEKARIGDGVGGEPRVAGAGAEEILEELRAIRKALEKK